MESFHFQVSFYPQELDKLIGHAFWAFELPNTVLDNRPIPKALMKIHRLFLSQLKPSC